MMFPLCYMARLLIQVTIATLSSFHLLKYNNIIIGPPKSDIESLLVSGGATIIHNIDLLESSSSTMKLIVTANTDSIEEMRIKLKTKRVGSNVRIVAVTWVLDSITNYTIESID